MPDRCALRFLLLFLRVIEGVAQKAVSVALVAGVAGHNRIERFGKSYFLHCLIPLLARAAMISNNAPVGNSLPAIFQDVTGSCRLCLILFRHGLGEIHRFHRNPDGPRGGGAIREEARLSANVKRRRAVRFLQRPGKAFLENGHSAGERAGRAADDYWESFPIGWENTGRRNGALGLSHGPDRLL